MVTQFGLGSRTCLGKHISILEMSKLIPQLVRRFDFELEQPAKPWTTENYWFVKPVDFRLRAKAREGGTAGVNRSHTSFPRTAHHV